MDTHSLLQPILDHIEDNLCSELSVSDLAARAGFSSYHFHRIFHHAIGYPVAQYIRRRRLLHAVYAMRCGLTGIQAALQYSFSTYSGFYRAFMREFSCTPIAYLRAGHATRPHRPNLFKEAHIPMTHDLAAKILQHWSLSHLPITDVFYESTGERNEHAVYVSTDYVLKFSADKTKLLTHMQLSAALAKEGLLSATPIPTSDGESLVGHDNGWFFLSRRLPGVPLRAAELLTETGLPLAHPFGAALGRLHQALSHLDLPIPDAEPPADTLSWALSRVRDHLLLPADLTRRLTATLAELAPHLPHQIIHRDPNPSNLLVSNEGWSFIDFDLSQRSLRLFDPCYAATAVLSETIRTADAAKLTAWLAFYHDLLRGYDSIAHLTAEEKTALPCLLLADQLRCTAWFADQPQYKEIFTANRRMTTFLIDHFDDLHFPQ